MSRVYDKSISEKYKKYFSSIGDMIKPFPVYSISKQKPMIDSKNILKKWDTGSVGIPLAWNKNNNTVAVDHTDSHTLVVGPTGSKKSRLVVMPLVRILGSTGESMIISDPKAEIYNRTAGFLKDKGYCIHILNLRAPLHGDRWNPLDIPFEAYSRGEIDKAYEFVNDIAENLIQTEKSNSDPFWDNSAGSFFFGLTLLLFKYCKDFHKSKEYIHIGNVVELRNILLFGTNGEKNKILWSYAKKDPIICSALIGTVEAAKETRGSILSVFDQKMRMFSIQPGLLDMLSVNDINMNIIGNQPTAIFLIVPDEKTGFHGLVSLFIKQSYEYMIYKAQDISGQDGFQIGTLKNRVNYVLDEFSSLPTIKDFPAMITAARSRNIRFTLVIQSKHQLLQRYSDETETIQTNCNNWVFLTSRELQLLEELSALCGKTIGDNPQPILSVSLLQRLDKEEGEVLLLCGRSKPCVSFLPDISVYDNNKYTCPAVNARTSNRPPILAVNIVDVSNYMIEENIDKRVLPNQDFDLIVSGIKQKFAEIETEKSQKNKSEVDSEAFNIEEIIGGSKVDE